MAPGWASPPAAPGRLSSSIPSGAYPEPERELVLDSDLVDLELEPSHPRSPPGQPSLHSSSSSTAAPALLSVTSPQSPSLVRRKPLPQNASPVIPGQSRLSTVSAVTSFPGGETPADPPNPTALTTTTSSSAANSAPTHYHSSSSPSSTPSSVHDGPSVFVPRDLDRFPRGGPSASRHLRIDTSTSFVHLDDSSDEDGGYPSQFTNGTPVHSRLVSEPFVPVLKSPPIIHKRAATMALHLPSNRPPPLHIDSVRGMQAAMDSKHQQQPPKTPANKISNFFGWRAQSSSPGADSSSTEISDTGRSPLPSPMPQSLPSASFSITPSTTVPLDQSRPSGPLPPMPMRNLSLSSAGMAESGSTTLVAEIENELREISSELAGSIRREMELEDLVERLQSEMPLDTPNRRTSDYFSDSGSSSIRYTYDGRLEDVEKFRRTAEQERAQLKVDLTQKWHEERSRRAATESHVQILESQVQQLRRERAEFSDLSSRAKELESALESARRKLAEERQIKDNFEDLLTAMRVELEQLRNERDQLRDDVIPQLQHGQGGSANPSEVQRLLEEVEALKVENASLAQLQGSRFASIAEEDGLSSRRNSGMGLSRSNSLARGMHSKSNGPSGLSRSNSLSRANTISGRERDTNTRESLADRVEGAEAQRDALHQSLRRLLDRQAHDAREYEKRIKLMELQVLRAQQSGSPRRLGYEREVRNLRDEVNHLRARAQDALDQKWQSEKGLAGLKMDLDRAEQETSSLRDLLQEHDITAPEEVETDRDGFAEVIATSSSLESAYKQLQADRENAEASAAQSPQENGDLAASVSRTEVLAQNVRRQLDTNHSLRSRLADAIGKGEKDQQVSATRINEMQARLKELEEQLMLAQQHSEEEMARHDEELRHLEETHNAQLMRFKDNGGRSPSTLSPLPPSTPFGSRSPRLDKTTSGDGMTLTQAIQSEALERRVKELERLLREADIEMSEVVSRMNRAQIDVAELQSDRDEALRQTRRLQSEIQAEREAFKTLMG